MTTVGEVFDKRGPCVLMALVMDLAREAGCLPCGEWDYRFTSDATWRLCVNGGTSPTWQPHDGPDIPRFNAYVEHGGFPAALFDTVSGTVVGDSEDKIIAAFDAEIAALRAR